jgi:hypothetical protein
VTDYAKQLQPGQVFKFKSGPTVYFVSPNKEAIAFGDEAAYQGFFGDKDWSRVQTFNVDRPNIDASSSWTGISMGATAAKEYAKLGIIPTPTTPSLYTPPAPAFQLDTSKILTPSLKDLTNTLTQPIQLPADYERISAKAKLAEQGYTYIPDPAMLKGLTENQIYRQGSMVFAKPGVDVPGLVDEQVRQDIINQFKQISTQVSAPAGFTVDTSQYDKIVGDAQNKGLFKIPDISGLSSSITDFISPLLTSINTMQEQIKTFQTQQSDLMKQYTTAITGAPATSQLYEQTLAKYGITTETFNQINSYTSQLTTYNKELADLDAEKKKAIADAEKATVSTGVISRNTAQIEKDYNSRISTKAAQAGVVATSLEALRGNIATASQLAGNVVDAATYDYKVKLDGMRNLLSMNLKQMEGVSSQQMNQLKLALETYQKTYEDQRTKKQKILTTIMQYPKADYTGLDLSKAKMIDVAARVITSPYYNAEDIDDDQTVIDAYAKTYADAGILSTDSRATAINKILNKSKIYQNQVKKTTEAPTSYQEWQLAGGKAGTGKSYAEWVAKASGLTDYQTITRVDKLASQFDNEKVVQRYNVVAEGYQFARNINTATETSANDIGLLYAFAKAMDPDSVVREGEYATVQKYAQSWADQFKFKMERIFSNKPFLTKEAKDNMVATIKEKYNSIYPSYQNVFNEYGRRIDDITKQRETGTQYLTDYAKPYRTTSGAGISAGQKLNWGDLLDSEKNLNLNSIGWDDL